MALGFAKRFNDLEVWQRAFKISIEIHKSSLEFPKIEQYATASANEVLTWILYCQELEYIDKDTARRWYYLEVCKMLNGLSQKI